MKQFFKSSKFHAALWILGGVVVLLLAFGFGVAVGSRELAFRTRFGENYFQNFYGPGGAVSFSNMNSSGSGNGMPMPGMFRPSNAHGATGKIIDVASGSFSMADGDGDEFSVALPAGTLIRQGAVTIAPGGLRVGDMIAVIGAPNEQGQIEARFIRVFVVATSSAATSASGAGSSL